MIKISSQIITEQVEIKLLEIFNLQAIRCKIEGIALFLNLQDFEKFMVFKRISELCKIKVQTLLMSLLVLLSCGFVLYIGESVILYMISFIYPAYMSFKAEDSKNEKLVIHYVRYWIVFSFLQAVNPILKFLPYWKVINIFLLLWLQNTTSQGGRYVYVKFLRKILKRYELNIDEGIKQVQLRESIKPIMNQNKRQD